MPLSYADAHNDLLLACLHKAERGHVDPFGDDWLPGLRQGGIDFQVLPIFTEDQFIGEGALRRTLEVISLAREIASTHSSDVSIVETASDIKAALADNKIALLLALEGAEPVGSSLSMIETMWRLGVRMASFTWNRRTMLADGIAERQTGSRLSSLGVEAVAEMNRLGMVLDISHLSAPGVDHLAQLSTRAFVASHSSCHALCDHPRNLTNDQLRVVADSGGFVAMNAFGSFLAKGEATIADFVDHLAHAVDIVGQDNVGIGADFIKDFIDMVDPILGRQLLVRPEDLSFLEHFKAPAQYPNLTDLLRERFGEMGAAKVAGLNIIEFFLSELPAGEAAIANA